MRLNVTVSAPASPSLLGVAPSGDVRLKVRAARADSRAMTRHRITFAALLALWPIHLAAWVHAAGVILL